MKKLQEFRSLDRSLRLQKIIDTAVDLFHIKGYRATTLGDIARSLNITQAALYHYVSSKEKLLSIIYIQALENIFKTTDKIFRLDLPPDEKLRRILQNHIKNIIIHSLSLFSVFFTEENELPEKNYLTIQKEKKKYTKLVEEIIEAGIAQGLFKDVNTRLQAYGIIGMCNWVYKWYKPEHSPYSPEEVADHFVSLLETGYLKNPRPYENQDATISITAARNGPSEKSQIAIEALKSQCRSMLALLEKIQHP
jgi:AcrR family transcriptional regulator